VPSFPNGANDMTTATSELADPGLRATMAAEWTKLRSVRSTWVTLAIAMVIGVGLSVLFTFASSTTFHTMSPAARANFDSAGTTLVGVNLSLILFAVLGALATSSEYASGMIRLTLTITPNRLRLLLAKAIVVVIPSYVFGALFATISFLAGQAIIRGADPTLAVGFGSPNVVSTLINWGSENTAFALIAMALGILLRSAAGAIATAIGIIFGPLIVGQLLPAWFQRHILAYLPDSAAGNLTNPRPDHSSATYLDPQVASWVLGAWVVGFLVFAYLVMNKRDSG
jgi:ABC-2 type transport system permease protein